MNTEISYPLSLLSSVSHTCLLAGPLWLRKITTYPHVHVERPDDRNSKFKIYISEFILDSYEYMPEPYVITHCVILPRLLRVAFFVGTGGFLN